MPSEEAWNSYNILYGMANVQVVWSYSKLDNFLIIMFRFKQFKAEDINYEHLTCLSD